MEIPRVIRKRCEQFYKQHQVTLHDLKLLLQSQVFPTSWLARTKLLLPSEPQTVVVREMDKVFNDSVHGHIKVPPLCVKIIDTPEFQRLRNLKQLGLAYLVYPGASHNRFEHSLGVCYLAGQMVDQLRQSCHDAPPISDKDKLCLEIAGLCHDLGHGPFSHTWERFVNPIRRNNKLPKWEHEDSSLLMLDALIENNNLMPEFQKYELLTADIKLIKDLIRGKKSAESRMHNPYLYQIIANKDNDIDVDKWDYFMRDGLHLNLRESFDYRRLLASCRLSRVPQDHNRWHVCYRDKDVINIWNMFQVRARLHYQSYQHTVVKSLETMLIDALTKADEGGYRILLPDGSGVRLSESQDDVAAWCRVTDHIFYEILFSINPELQEARDILQRILTRDIYTLVAKCRIESPEELETKRACLVDFCANTKRFRLDEFRFTQLKLDLGSANANPFEQVYLYEKHSPNTATSRDIQDIPMFPVRSTDLLRTDLLLFCARKKKDVTEVDCQDIQNVVQ